jgi:CrcB protein
MTPLLALGVVVAGALGAVLRYLVAMAFGTRAGIPWAVLVVNVTGSAIGGAVIGLAAEAGLASDLRLLLLTGLCGGLTTFSTWSVETLQLLADGKSKGAIRSVVGNLVLGLGAATGAYALVVALV